MSQESPLPDHLARRAERGSWYSANDALKVLDWLEGSSRRFLGFDSARRGSDGKWILLLDPILDCSGWKDSAQSINFGRELIGRHTDLMFDLVWDEAV